MLTKTKTQAQKFPLHVNFIYALCCVIDAQWLRNLLPMERLIFTREKTSKQYYLLERQVYRYHHSLVCRGISLEKRYHDHYRLIAIKYGWPYIREVYDRD